MAMSQLAPFQVAGSGRGSNWSLGLCCLLSSLALEASKPLWDQKVAVGLSQEGQNLPPSPACL